MSPRPSQLFTKTVKAFRKARIFQEKGRDDTDISFCHTFVSPDEELEFTIKEIIHWKEESNIALQIKPTCKPFDENLQTKMYKRAKKMFLKASKHKTRAQQISCRSIVSKDDMFFSLLKAAWEHK